jgi:hypothetical protein
MDYTTELAGTPSEEVAGKAVGLWQLLRKYATPRLTAAAVIWRFEAYTVTPLVIFCVETFGRWDGALVVGAIMAVYSAIFLFLLNGERVVDALREWLRGRRFVRRFVLPVRHSEGLAGIAARRLSAPASFMFLGPFQRAVTYRVLGLRDYVAYPLSVGGAIPHSLFWTGLVFGSAWELAIRPAALWVAGGIGDLASRLF